MVITTLLGGSIEHPVLDPLQLGVRFLGPALRVRSLHALPVLMLVSLEVPLLLLAVQLQSGESCLIVSVSLVMYWHLIWGCPAAPCPLLPALDTHLQKAHRFLADSL